jgi:hypothetical protein
MPLASSEKSQIFSAVYTGGAHDPTEGCETSHELFKVLDIHDWTHLCDG